MINFTVGPVQMDEETLLIGKKQIPYFRTSEFSQIMKENESLLCEYFDAPEKSRAIFLTASGTGSMEAGIMNFFTSKDKVLVVNGGSFGERFVLLCKVHEIPFTEIKLKFGEPLTLEKLKPFEQQGFTGFIVQLCETSSGVLYDMNMIGQFCCRNNCFLFVDAISGFLADEISMKKNHINAAITGSQKTLSLPPSMSFTILDEEAQKRCYENKIRSMYFNYEDYLLNGERGQTPFTPAVSTLFQLYEKLQRIKKTGGISVLNETVKNRATYFRDRIRHLPLKMFVPVESASNCVTALCPTNSNVNACEIFKILKDEYSIWICPNGGEFAEKIFRIGHIGSMTQDDIDTLINAFDSLVTRNLL